jgi:hypothetical protein
MALILVDDSRDGSVVPKCLVARKIRLCNEMMTHCGENLVD